MKNRTIDSFLKRLFHFDIIVTLSIFVTIVLSVASCSQSAKNDKNAAKDDIYPIIDLADAIENPKKPLILSDFIEDIEYIRPEYPSSLVDFIFGISVNDDYLLLEDRDRLLCYTREGKFIREISRKGQGPKEHLGIRSSALYNDIIAINSNYNRKVLWYDANGDFLDQTPVSDNVFKINILDTNRVAIHLQHGISMEDPGLFITGILDRNGDTIQLKKTTPYYPKGIVSSPSVWKCNDTVRVLTCLNDTVYSVTRDEITPAYIINFGEYKVSPEAFVNTRLLQEERSQYINNYSFCETIQHLFITFQYNRKRWFSVYDKQTANISAWSIEPDDINKYGFIKGGGWINDIDGGISPTDFHWASSNYFVGTILPEELKEQFQNKKNSKVKYPEKQKQLEKMVNSLNEDENQIIILYKLKK